MVEVSADVLFMYRYFSLYNSPYPAHREGCAIDLYPALLSAPSPVAGKVKMIRRVRTPKRPYAEPFDYLIVIDTGARYARILHVDPTVREGDEVREGMSLGRVVRSGFFAPWVENHIHLGYRSYDADPVRATGSEPIGVSVPIREVIWDGSGQVITRGDSFVILEGPGHPCPGEAFAGISGENGVLDGGFPHYSGGGIHGETTGTVTLLGEQIGTLGEHAVTWDNVRVVVDGHAVTGISFVVHRDTVRVKLVSRNEIPIHVGEEVTVQIVCETTKTSGGRRT